MGEPAASVMVPLEKLVLVKAKCTVEELGRFLVETRFEYRH